MTYIAAILARRPGARVEVNEDTGEIIRWHGKDAPPTKAELAEWRKADEAKPREPSLAEKVEILWAERNSKK